MNPSRRTGGPGLVAWAALAGMFATGATAFGIDAAKKTPAQWVAQLGAGHLAERDEASAALLALGAKARGDVRAALDSQDAEIKARTRELWKTLRWDVVPGAEEETAKLLAGIEKEQSDPGNNVDSRANYDAWHYFVKKHGAESLRLIAEFHRAGFPPDDYMDGLSFVLQATPTPDLTDLFARAKQTGEKDFLEAPLDDIFPAGAEPGVAEGWVALRVSLGEYEKAYEFGRAAAFRPGRACAADLITECAVAVRRGVLLDKAAADGLKDVAAVADPNALCARLAFYAGIMGGLHKPARFDALCDAVRGAGPLAADNDFLELLVKALLDAGMPDRAVKTLRDAKTPLALYMRAYAGNRMKDTRASEADWAQTQAATDAISDAGLRKSAWYDIAELMQKWNDPRAEQLWLKIIDMQPVDSDNEANACFQLGDLLKYKKQYALSAVFLEKGMELSKDGILSTTDSDGWINYDETAMSDEIKRLQIMAEGQKPGISDEPLAAGDKPSPSKPDKTPAP